MSKPRDKMNECYSCIHRREIAGDCHSNCAKPDKKMTGNPHGKKKGWFCYPWNFDPIWKEKDCSNYQTSEAVSGAVSPENNHT